MSTNLDIFISRCVEIKKNGQGIKQIQKEFLRICRHLAPEEQKEFRAEVTIFLPEFIKNFFIS